MTTGERTHREILTGIAVRAMSEHGLLTDFSPEAQEELAHLQAPQPDTAVLRDLRDLPWCSIDNDQSRDLDQLSVAQTLPGREVKILVAIADVDALVKDGTAINAHAVHNTTSVYTPAIIFSMLPEKLSTDLTSLNESEDRVAMVVEMVVGPDGSLEGEDVYSAVVRNHARLNYDGVGAWLEGASPVPAAMEAVEGLVDNLRLQDRVGQDMKKFRYSHGALSFETRSAEPVMDGDRLSHMEVDQKTRSKEMVENFMIVANGVTARFLSAHHFPSIRRVVHAPSRWDRIVEIARLHGELLPNEPDSVALEKLLLKQKAVDPKGFADLSLAIIKLVGAGEYAAEPPDDRVPDHFGLAAHDYAHSTAPNRRYPDLLTQRLIKAALAGQQTPYGLQELQELAKHLTFQEDQARKVERQVDKSAAALLFQDQIGKRFDAMVTGASPKGTWVRLLKVPVEGKLVEGFQGADVGDHLQVELAAVEVEAGFIDFRRVQ
jgi:VacB/RNase II family 3'-5' exoribonuclease